MLNFAFMSYLDASETCGQFFSRLPEAKESTAMFFFFFPRDDPFTED